MDKFIVFEFMEWGGDWECVGTFDAMSDAVRCTDQRRETAFEIAFDTFEFAAHFNQDRNIEVRGETMWAWNIAKVWLPTFGE